MLGRFLSSLEESGLFPHRSFHIDRWPDTLEAQSQAKPRKSQQKGHNSRRNFQISSAEWVTRSGRIGRPSALNVATWSEFNLISNPAINKLDIHCNRMSETELIRPDWCDGCRIQSSDEEDVWHRPCETVRLVALAGASNVPVPFSCLFFFRLFVPPPPPPPRCE